MLLVWSCLIILSVVFVYFGVPLIHGRFVRRMLRRKAVRSKALVLTFDDGPGNRLTSELMNIFEEHNVRVSFFPLGRNIVGREALLKQMADKGHEICSHGYDHLNHWKVSPFRAVSDIRRGWETIDAVLGRKGGKYPFRPPNGKLNIVGLLYLLFHNVPIIYWVADAGDTWPVKPDSRWLADSARRTGGTVSLAHDFDRRDLSTEEFVLNSTRSALVTAKECGMKVLTLSELLGRRSWMSR
jgi:peptidoglycan/xylan/chitin deacetylase (PgdA/CDA1 family)